MTLKVDSVGHRGDGIAYDDGRQIFVPHTLANETIIADVTGDRGHLLELVEPSQERVDPICPHFGTCGGCSLQHMNADAYLGFKKNLVEAALSARDIKTDIKDVISIPTGTRRRTSLVSRRLKNGVTLGYHNARTNDVFDVQACPILRPEIVAAFDHLKALAALLAPRKGELRFNILSTREGLDIDIEGLSDWPDFAIEQKLTTLTLQAGFARLSIKGEILIAPKNPTLDFEGITLQVPSGAFTQATQQSEEIMANHVLEETKGAKKVADLFSGIGTFTLRLARQAAVYAAESNKPAITALDKAVRNTSGLKPVSTEVRDLALRPLGTKELNQFDAVVLNPPRAGAREQCEMLAQSKTSKIVYVSCAPATFARDARLLIDGGFRLLSAQPVDQFLFSHHIECIGVFERD